MMKLIRLLAAGLSLLVVLAACAPEPEIVVITREVISDVPVTVEVTRVVPEEVTVEVPVEVEVEVTRVVEVTKLATVVSEVEGTPSPTEESSTPSPSPTFTPSASPTPSPEPTIAGIYTVKPGDTTYTIYLETGVPVATIAAANNLANFRVISVGQQLVIPGWPGTPTAERPTRVSASSAPASTPAPAVGANLLPNPSFEGDWYFYNGVSEWQLPDSWLLAVDEGPNNLDPGSGGNFLRPEIRVITRADLPGDESSQFVFEGNKTIKAFKGGAPTNFAIFTDVALPAGSYRFTASFFPDTVATYEGSQKVWSVEPLAAEYRIIFNNAGTGWNAATVGNRNIRTYEFTLDSPQTVRLGVGFRNRFNAANNGWFIDNWSLQEIGD
jgi:LysM repeat protein